MINCIFSKTNCNILQGDIMFDGLDDTEATKMLQKYNERKMQFVYISAGIAALIISLKVLYYAAGV